MNPLLIELETAERTAVLPEGPEHERSLRLLGWPRVLDLIAGRCRTRRGAAAVRAARPFVDLPPVDLRRTLQDELRTAVDDDDSPPLSETGDALDLLERPRPLRCDGADLLHLATTAESLEDLRDWCTRRGAAAPRWSDAATLLPSLRTVADPIRRVLDRDGRVRDDASPRLRVLRREARTRERAVRAAMTDHLARAQRKGWTTGPEVTLRGDRFCLPLRAGDRRRVDGIVHDRSASGGTIFVEPADVVQTQNDLVESRLETAAEIDRLLLELNAVVEANAEVLTEAAVFQRRVDETLAAVRWSRETAGVRPDLESGIAPDVRRARHPLLMAQAVEADEVVPLDLDWPAGSRAVVISGPNAGGKSVALKGLGVHILLAQCGWDVPAAPGTRLPLVRRLFVDLGDDQSIARSLSSFSAHLDHLGRFLADADADTLVLCDELGSGTDPDEGTALALGVLEHLVDRGALVLATTHYGLLKAAVDDHPLMTNAAMDFDEATLSPLYTLRLGVPGASHAFDIAARMDFPADLLARARDRVGEDRFRIERLLTELGARARAAAEEQERLTAAAEAAESDARALSDRLEGLDAERARELDAARREGETFLAEARRTLERVVKELRTAGADERTIKYGQEELARLADGVPGSAGSGAAPTREARPGDRVRIPHLGWNGVVTEARGDRLVVDAEGTRLTLDADAVEILPDGGAKADPTPGRDTRPVDWSRLAADAPAVHEIDLRGYRADEAWEAVDRLLDRAVPSGARELRIIHGHGTGALRTMLRDRLARDARVARCDDAPPDAGGDGCTIATLTD